MSNISKHDRRPEPEIEPPKRGGSVPITAWCYRCGDTHRWAEPCPAEEVETDD